MGKFMNRIITLQLKINGQDETIKSRPFDMECYRLMYDSFHVENQSRDEGALAGLRNLFPSVDLLKALSPGALIAAICNLLMLYSDVKSYAKKKEVLRAGEGHPIYGIYQRFLQSHGRLPSEIDRQDPAFLLQILTEEHTDEITADQIPPHLRMYYGG